MLQSFAGVVECPVKSELFVGVQQEKGIISVSSKDTEFPICGLHIADTYQSDSLRKGNLFTGEKTLIVESTDCSPSVNLCPLPLWMAALLQGQAGTTRPPRLHSTAVPATITITSLLFITLDLPVPIRCFKQACHQGCNRFSRPPIYALTQQFAQGCRALCW